MKKIVSALSLAAYLSFATSAFATAGTVNACASGQFNLLCQLSLSSFSNVVGLAIQLIFVLAIIVALFYLIYGGFRWLTSTGDKQQVQVARDHIVAAIIGLVVIFLSYFILNILLGFFTNNTVNLSNLQIPALH